MSIPVGNKIRYFLTIGELEHLTTQQGRAMSNDDPMKKRFFKRLPNRLLNLYGAYTKLKISLFHRYSRLSNFMNGISVFAAIKRHVENKNKREKISLCHICSPTCKMASYRPLCTSLCNLERDWELSVPRSPYMANLGAQLVPFLVALKL